MVVRFAQWREQGWQNDEGKVVAVVRTPRRRMWVEFVGYLRFLERFPLRICSLHLLGELTRVTNFSWLIQVQHAYSKQWKHRQAAMENVDREVTADTPELTADKDARKVAKATVQLIQKGVKDQVFSVSFFIWDESNS